MNIETLINADFRGCIQVVRHGETILKRHMDSPTWPIIPNEPDTKFATASAGKVFLWRREYYS